MSNSQRLLTKLAPKNLLKHPYYVKWNEGKLSQAILQNYAKQYYHHVRNFPQCLSALHSQSPSIAERQILLENLVDEEMGDKNHQQLWLNFCNGLNVSDEQVKDVKLSEAATHLTDKFSELSRNSYKQGLGALFAHEYQYSDISKTKKDGLIKHYGITNDADLEFFTVHSDVDVWHTQQLTDIIDGEAMNDEEAYKEMEKGAIEAADALWGFLDYMDQQFEQEKVAENYA